MLAQAEFVQKSKEHNGGNVREELTQLGREVAELRVAVMAEKLAKTVCNDLLRLSCGAHLAGRDGRCGC